MNEGEMASSAADDVGFGLEMLTRFYADARNKTQNALTEVLGDLQQVDVPNLAASLVPPYSDEVRALGHLMVGHPVDDESAQRIVYDAAFACVVQELGQKEH